MNGKMFWARTIRKDNEIVPIQTVDEHLRNVSRLCGINTMKFNVPTLGKVMGLLHDMGKYSELFQRRLFDERISCDHSTLGATLLSKLINGVVKVNAMCEMLSLSVISHHTGLIDMINDDFENNFMQRTNKITTEEMIHVQNCARDVIETLSVLINSDAFGNETNYIFEQLNVIEKRSRENLTNRKFIECLFQKLLYSCLIDADRLDSAAAVYGEDKIAFRDWNFILSAIDDKLKSFPQNELNLTRSDICNKCCSLSKEPIGFYKFAIPTGGGKTLSSLRFAVEHAKKHALNRIVYVIPYISIIEQNAGVVKELLGSDMDIVVESHSNIFERENKSPYLYALEDNWSGQIIFTTMVQFLESIYGSGTQGIRRFHNLCNTVIIFDEIQSLPIKCIYTATMLMRFLVEFCNSTIVLCSATQPLLDALPLKKRSLPKMKEVNFPIRECLSRTVIDDRTTKTGYTYDEIFSMMVDEFYNVDSLLVIVNTKSSANVLYEMAIGLYDKVFYLTTNMCAEHRLDYINEMKKLINKGEKIICISTQLIEAGVDIDFQCVFRFMSGLDSIIQAAGRCNREGKMKRKGNVYILNSNQEDVSMLPEIKCGQEQTQRILNEIKQGEHDCDIQSSSAIKRYYEYYLEKQKQKMDYPIPKSNETIFNLLSNNKSLADEYSRNNKERTFMLQSFKTAADNYSVIGTAQVGVIVPYKDGKYLIDNMDKLSPKEIMQKANRFMVNVYVNQLNRDGIYVTHNGLYFTDCLCYNEHKGLDLDNKQQIEFEGGIYG